MLFLWWFSTHRLMLSVRVFCSLLYLSDYKKRFHFTPWVEMVEVIPRYIDKMEEPNMTSCRVELHMLHESLSSTIFHSLVSSPKTVHYLSVELKHLKTAVNIFKFSGSTSCFIRTSLLSRSPWSCPGAKCFLLGEPWPALVQFSSLMLLLLWTSLRFSAVFSA